MISIGNPLPLPELPCTRSTPAASAAAQLSYTVGGGAVGDGVGAGVGVRVGVGEGVGVGSGVGVGVRPIVGRGDGVGETAGVGEGLRLGLGVRVALGTIVGVPLIVGRGVEVPVTVGVPEAVALGVGVMVGDGVGVGVGSTITGSSAHSSSIVRSALTSAVSAVSPQNTFTAIQSCAYWHHAVSSGGFHSAGSRPPLERLLDEETAVRVCGSVRSLA